MNLPSVAFIGTGIMGLPMARNLLHAGFPVRAWNRSPASCRRWQHWGRRLRRPRQARQTVLRC